MAGWNKDISHCKQATTMTNNTHWWQKPDIPIMEPTLVTDEMMTKPKPSFSRRVTVTSKGCISGNELCALSGEAVSPTSQNINYNFLSKNFTNFKLIANIMRLNNINKLTNLTNFGNFGYSSAQMSGYILQVTNICIGVALCLNCGKPLHQKQISTSLRLYRVTHWGTSWKSWYQYSHIQTAIIFPFLLWGIKCKVQVGIRNEPNNELADGCTRNTCKSFQLLWEKSFGFLTAQHL